MYSILIVAALSASEPSYRHVEKAHAHKTVSRGHGPVAVSASGYGCTGSHGPVVASSGCTGGYGHSVTRSRGFSNPVAVVVSPSYQAMPRYQSSCPTCPNYVAPIQSRPKVNQ